MNHRLTQITQIAGPGHLVMTRPGAAPARHHDLDGDQSRHAAEHAKATAYSEEMLPRPQRLLCDVRMFTIERPE